MAHIVMPSLAYMSLVNLKVCISNVLLQRSVFIYKIYQNHPYCRPNIYFKMTVGHVCADIQAIRLLNQQH